MSSEVNGKAEYVQNSIQVSYGEFESVVGLGRACDVFCGCCFVPIPDGPPFTSDARRTNFRLHSRVGACPFTSVI